MIIWNIKLKNILFIQKESLDTLSEMVNFDIDE